jgi:hypothetical protein
MNTKLAPRAFPTTVDPLPTLSDRAGLSLLQRLIGLDARDRRKLAAENRDVLELFRTQVTAALVPADPGRIVDMVGALFLHYPARSLSDKAAASVATDWIADLGAMPDDIVEAACVTWRRGQNQYAPTPGHLLEIARPIQTMRTFLLSQTTRLLEGDAAVSPPPSRPGSSKD